MPFFSRKARRLMAVALVVSLCPAVASAQDSSLKAPTIAASIAAAADWASTYHALKNYQVRETNPMLRPLDSSPGSMVTLGALIDAGSVSAWNLTVGKKHPKAAAIGLWAMTAFRAYITIHNVRNIRQAERR